jgi:hypothetical protein
MVARSFSFWEKNHHAKPILFFSPPAGRTKRLDFKASSALRAESNNGDPCQGLKSLAINVRPPGEIRLGDIFYQ